MILGILSRISLEGEFMMAKIIVVGGSFAGLTAAYELRKKLGTEHQVLVLSNNPKFVFIPSMPWVAPPERTPIPTGVPKTGYMSEHMAKTAAANVVAKPVFPPPGEAHVASG